MNKPKLNRPWLVAVWPGMGHVALSAGYYMLSKLAMHELAEFPANELFDVDFAAVQQGRILPTQRPRSRFFVWKNDDAEHDIVLFIGEAQPPLGKYAFCQRMIEFARDLGVERVITFAAMASGMRPDQESRVFAAGTDAELVAELDQTSLHLLDEGQIVGLNGVLLGAAADKGMQGICLLGEMPQIFSQFPFPKASLAVLRAFAEMAEFSLDVTELQEQAEASETALLEFITNLQQRLEPQDRDDEFVPTPTEEGLPNDQIEQIEILFREASQDRSKAYELKRELDRLEVFDEYEDRFLDLFKKSDEEDA